MRGIIIKTICLLAFLARSFAFNKKYPSLETFGDAPEPWLPLHGGSFSGPPQPFSPDPLVQYQWPADGSINDEDLQLFSVSPIDCGPHDDSSKNSFENVTSCDGSSTSTAITVTGQGTLIIDFGVELPAFLEIDITNLQDADLNNLQFGIGEYTEVDWVGGFKRDTPKKYGSSCGAGTCTYRLETSNTPTEYYEGVRYGFVILSSPPSAPFILSSIRAVTQTKTVNYTGSFSSAGDPLVERVWYTAAYTVRATAQSTYMGSILMNRGDRFSWTGDAHPSQATSMTAFSNYAFVFNNLNRSKADCQGIATYCLYFVLSVGDYFRETGDAAGVAYLTPNVEDHLNQAVNMWHDPEGLRFVGWDDRTGSGFANNTTPETQALYRLLAIRAFATAGDFFTKTGNSALGTLYSSYATNFTAMIRSMSQGSANWYSTFGLHAGADAVNAGFLTQDEMNGIASGPISDVVALPSQSNFNQYFILQALAGLGQLDRGVESIRIIWGSIVTAGATTFWETSHPSWVDLFPSGPAPPAAEQSGWVSYCHPWASGPTPWLTKWILGVRPVEPGYSRVLIAPHVAHSMHGVSGSLGTPHGIIQINATRAAEGQSTAKLHIVLPLGVNEAIVRLSSVLLKRLLGVNQLDDLSTIFIDGYQTSIVYPEDAPLIDESSISLGRAATVEIKVKGGMEHDFRISTKDASTSALKWEPLGSPFPPPSWPGQFLGSDSETQGNWIGKYGSDGYVLFGFDVQSVASDPFCGVIDENNDMTLQCLDTGATIQKILFASFGSGVSGQCGSYSAGSCNSNNSMSVVSNDCLGKNACTITPSNDHFGGDPCPGTSKRLWVTAHCSVGNGTQPGSTNPPTDRSKIPSYVTFARAVNYDGYCGKNFNWNASTMESRALQDPANPNGSRKIGFTQPCGCPTSPVDILLTDEAKASGKRYTLSAYFVDYAPSPSCQAYDGTQRSQEIYLLTGYPDLNPLTPRQALTDFKDGIWFSYNLVGDARVRISTIKGDFAVLSAIAFDP